MPGFVDEVSQDIVRGWYVAEDQWAPGRGVVISVNGEDRYCDLCQHARRDVLEAGITPRAEVGFLAFLELQVGDLVRVRAGDTGRLLGGGVSVVMPADASDGFLDAQACADLPAFRDIIGPLRASLEILAFRPLFGHRGKLSALCVETPAGKRVVHCQRPRLNAAWLERLHRQVLIPGAIDAPSLEAVIVHGETASLVVEHIDGQVLGSFPETSIEASTNDREQAYRATLASVLRLSTASWPDGMLRKQGVDSFSSETANADMSAVETDGVETTDVETTGAGKKADRRGRHALNRMIREVCLSALQRGRWRELGLLLRMTRTLYRLPRVFAHGDLHPHNVLIETRTGRPVFIDWDHAGMLPPGVDLSRLLLSVPPALAESWLGEHRAHRLGWLILTYFAQSQRQPDFQATEAGAYLRRRFRELARRSRAGPAATSPVR
ncbi:phosphotransferase [Salinicola sp. CPA57]|uniref:phosphotransferase n=1 Tax=Salinicola sp. CPA57 TaxID=1949080 RepID=UPI00130090A3|nr:phosphotransferase [Salinicola sp. CPA57]